MPQVNELTIKSVRSAELNDIPTCKAIADAHREALGFIVSASFADAIRRNQLLVADRAGKVVGFVRYNHRIRGNETALYDICVADSAQRQGVGRLLVAALSASCRLHGRHTIVLRCPENLPANEFYSHIGFQRINVEPGRRRPLVLWRLTLQES
ncbi:MAG: GNAT family N-acetyltransferase [Chloroflexaceae bacterium]|nr:GNAT family N-acetyltransferase [Chloroflexaceae bacterium]